MLLDEYNENLKDIKKQTIKGLFWSANSKFSVQIFNLIITAILARVLFPEDFGVVGMALIFISLISMINETGLSSAIIQKKDLSNQHLYTAFWVNIFTGIFLFIIAFFTSPLLSDFFRNDNVELIIKVSSISFLISSIALVNRSLLTRNLEFKKLAATEISGSIISGILAVYLALSGFGFWSLVARNLINDFIAILLTLIVYPWKPAIYFSKDCFMEMFGFGANVIGSSFLGYLRQNMDYIIVGRIMGAELLGYYTLAYTLAVYPIMKIAPIITKVIFPVFSRIKDDTIAYKNGYLKLISFLSILTVPALFGLLSIASEFIIVVYGDKWAASILPLQILCLLGIISSISPASGPVFYSKGVPEIEFKLSLVKLPITALALLIGSLYGIVGIATSMTIVAFVYYVITQKIINSLIKLSWKEYLKAIYIPILSSLTMGLLVISYKHIIYRLGNINDITILISSILVGILIYTIMMYRFNQEINQKIIRDVKQYKNKK
jgi:Membrane protein involved in the export of O-antigen and teichoic acid